MGQVLGKQNKNQSLPSGPKLPYSNSLKNEVDMRTDANLIMENGTVGNAGCDDKDCEDDKYGGREHQENEVQCFQVKKVRTKSKKEVDNVLNELLVKVTALEEAKRNQADAISKVTESCQVLSGYITEIRGVIEEATSYASIKQDAVEQRLVSVDKVNLNLIGDHVFLRKKVDALHARVETVMHNVVVALSSTE